MGQWLRSCHITKNRINFKVIKIIQFCLKICVLLRHPQLWIGGWVDGWVNALSVQKSIEHDYSRIIKVLAFQAMGSSTGVRHERLGLIFLLIFFL